MSDHQPLVSVIIPSYNHDRFITGCIESIVSQSYQNIELIVIDDGSTDQSRNILQMLQEKYKFVLVFQENAGIARTLNRGIREYAHGKYLAICASDDYWLPQKISIQVQYMDAHPESGMCFGKNHFVNDNSEIIQGYCRDYPMLKGGYIFEDIFLFRFHPHVNYMIRRSVYDTVGFYDEECITEDYDMNLRIAARYPIGFIDEFLGFYRIPASAMKIKRFEQLTASHLRIMESYRWHPLYKKATRRAYLRNFDTYAGFSGYKRKAFDNMVKALPLFFQPRFSVALTKLIFFHQTTEW